jgi:hypothetical protein
MKALDVVSDVAVSPVQRHTDSAEAEATFLMVSIRLRLMM